MSGTIATRPIFRERSEISRNCRSPSGTVRVKAEALIQAFNRGPVDAEKRERRRYIDLSKILKVRGESHDLDMFRTPCASLDAVQHQSCVDDVDGPQLKSSPNSNTTYSEAE